MNPDVAAAVNELERNGILPPEVAVRAGREARGELVPVRTELRIFYGVGSALVGTAAALLVHENLDRIGPATIAAALALATAGVFWWIRRKSPPFSPGEVPSPNLAFDAMLLLGTALLAATVAFTEWKLTPLGPHWRLHLLLMSAVYAALAVRYDSRPVLSLALSTFAAWRGFSTTPEAMLTTALGESGSRMANGVLCAAVFAAASAGIRVSGWKRHFERTTTFAAALAGLLGIGSALGDSTLAIGLVLLVVGTGILAFGVRIHRYELFALGLVAGYVGLSAVFLKTFHDEILGCGWFSLTSLAVVATLIVMARRLREPEGDE